MMKIYTNALITVITIIVVVKRQSCEAEYAKTLAKIHI